MAVHASALKTVLLAAIEENRYLLSFSGFTVEMPDNDINVYTDEKSASFLFAAKLYAMQWPTAARKVRS